MSIYGIIRYILYIYVYVWYTFSFFIFFWYEGNTVGTRGGLGPKSGPPNPVPNTPHHTINEWHILDIVFSGVWQIVNHCKEVLRGTI